MTQAEYTINSYFITYPVKFSPPTPTLKQEERKWITQTQESFYFCSMQTDSTYTYPVSFYILYHILTIFCQII